MMFNNLKFLVYILGVTLAISSCGGGGGGGDRSDFTAWKYGEEDWGGFDKADYEGQVEAPNLVLIDFLIELCISLISSIDAVFPVPIAHIGS